MRPVCVLLCALALPWGCALPSPAPQAETSSPKPSPASNLKVSLRQIVSRPEQETITSLWIFVSGKKAGETPPDLKSKTTHWEARLSPGNYPMRFELWRLMRDDTWSAEPQKKQPPPRFVLIKEGLRTHVQIKYYDDEKAPDFRIDREPI